MPMPSITQLKTLAIVPKVTALLSMFGSGCIIRSALSTETSKTGPYHRILLGMSCYDMMSSFCMFLSTWPIPKGTRGVWAPLGNTATCTAQGFFVSMGVSGVAFYNSSLAIYYVLITRFNWPEDKVLSAERWMHVVTGFFAVVPSICGLPLKLFNNANLWCWIAPFPLNCKDSARYGEEANCIRGDNAWIYRFAFVLGPAWFCIFLATICMVLVYLTVLQQEKSVDKVQEDGLAVRTRSKRVAWQAFWYIVAFYATWGPPTLTRVLQALPQTQGKFFYPLIVVMATLLPLQGFSNFIVFSRSRYLQYKREFPRTSVIDAVKYAAFSVKKVRLSDDTSNLGTSSAMASSAIATEAILQSESIPGK